MKLKFLSLFLALGMFVLGANVMAEEEKAPAGEAQQEELKLTEVEEQTIKDPAGSLLCSALLKVKDQISWPAICETACNKANPSVIDLGKCAAAVAHENATTYPQITKVENAIATACNLGCTSKKCLFGKCIQGTCNVPAVLNACGYICCNIPPAASKVTNCLSSYGAAGKNTCANYTEVAPE